MPYADPDARREYAKRWIAKRRADWFAENGPCTRCGSDDRLQLDHIDPLQKVSHKVWSWSQERRDIELAKCRVLCFECHLKKSATERALGEKHGRAKLTTRQVLEIRRRAFNGEKAVDLSREFGLEARYANKIINRERWAWL